jgi:hypothetical protein
MSCWGPRKDLQRLLSLTGELIELRGRNRIAGWHISVFTQWIDEGSVLLQPVMQVRPGGEAAVTDAANR